MGHGFTRWNTISVSDSWLGRGSMLSVNERHNKEKVSNSIVLFTLRIYTAQITYKIHCREISRQENFVYFSKWTIAGYLTIERLFIVINAELNFVVFIFFFLPPATEMGKCSTRGVPLCRWLRSLLQLPGWLVVVGCLPLWIGHRIPTVWHSFDHLGRGMPALFRGRPRPTQSRLAAFERSHRTGQ